MVTIFIMCEHFKMYIIVQSLFYTQNAILWFNYASIKKFFKGSFEFTLPPSMYENYDTTPLSAPATIFFCLVVVVMHAEFFKIRVN